MRAWRGLPVSIATDKNLVSRGLYLDLAPCGYHVFELAVSICKTTKEKAIAFKVKLRAAMFATCTMLAVVCGSVRADEVPIVTGEQSTRSSEQVKKVYLVGVANVIQVESAYHAANPPADAQSFVPRFARGLKGQTLESVMARLGAAPGPARP